MSDILSFKGYIKSINYDSKLLPRSIKTIKLDDFNVNTSPNFGIIEIAPNNLISYSIWKGPKRTRTYPFANIYNTYHLKLNHVTIIPIIKDEGADSSNNDRINAITYSWMNLLDKSIILACYKDAKKSARTGNYIAQQTLDNDLVITKLKEIIAHKNTAMHWNKDHFENDFETTYKTAVSNYQAISKTTGVSLHPSNQHLAVLNNFLDKQVFSLEKFKEVTLDRSKKAMNRESQTTHRNEFLEDGFKGVFEIENYVQGVYWLTADEIIYDKIPETYIIQESKNNSTGGQLPNLNDIKDGLFKLILYSNLDSLKLEDKEVKFKVRLKLTGSLKGSILLPTTDANVETFIKDASLRKTYATIVRCLNQEATANNLEAFIKGN